MPATYEPIATTTLSVNTTSINFSSIPSTYTDLRIIVIGTVVGVNQTIAVQFNNDTTAKYSWTWLVGSGSAGASGRSLTTSGKNYIPITDLYLGTSQTIPGFGQMDIFKYSSSNTNKTVLNQYAGDRSGSGTVGNLVGLWASISGITSIQIISDAGSGLKAGTIATLYGIAAA